MRKCLKTKKKAQFVCSKDGLLFPYLLTLGIGRPVKEITTLKNRLAWRIASPLFRSLGLPVGHGWDKTLLKIAELDEDVKSKLKEICCNHTLCGDKSVRVYKLKHHDYAMIEKKARSSIDKTSLLTKSFPYSLEEEDLSDVEIDDPEIVHVDEQEDHIYFVFASHKVVRVRDS